MTPRDYLKSLIAKIVAHSNRHRYSYTPTTLVASF